MAGATIVIKKYENRRLYDATSSRYVNLETVAAMVREGRDIQVVEAKTGEDVTRQVLTQIIVEGAKDGEAGPPLEFLRELVRAGDRAQRDFFQWYLRGASEVYHAVKENWEKAQRNSPANRLPEWARPWDPAVAAKAIARVLRRDSPDRPGADSGTTTSPFPSATPSSTSGELAALRARLDELERSLQEGMAPAGKSAARRKTPSRPEPARPARPARPRRTTRK